MAPPEQKQKAFDAYQDTLAPYIAKQRQEERARTADYMNSLMTQGPFMIMPTDEQLRKKDWRK